MDASDETISGWPPLRLLGRDEPNYIVMPEDSRKKIFARPDGRHAVSQFDIGPEEHHIEIFIEYERSFGRGEAFIETHDRMPQRKGTRKHAIITAYKPLARRAQDMMWGATAEEAEAFIREIKNFRNAFPELYEDAARASLARKTFRIKNPEKAL